MRHTKCLLDVAAGELVPSSRAFRTAPAGAEPPRPPALQLDSWRTQQLQTQVEGQRARHAAAAGSAGAAAAPGSNEAELQELLWQLRYGGSDAPGPSAAAAAAR